MILIVFAIVLICGFMIADAVIDYIFVCLYALAAMAITNNIIHAVRYYKKHGTVNPDDVKGSIRRDIKYITGQYSKVLGSRRFANKKSAKAWFALNGYEWILDYYTKDLEVDYNKFYMKYFSFISSIVQLKH